MSLDLLNQFQHLVKSVDELRQIRQVDIYPPQGQIFAAFDLCSIQNLKVVILGQDPYHTPSLAHGLAFSVPSEQRKLPPSLINIFKELQSDLGCEVLPRSGDLTHWAKQGVFLINTVLSVEKGKPGSHGHLGWQELVGKALQELAALKSNLVWVGWGKSAESVIEQLNLPKEHLVLLGPHPSPLSAHRGFFGQKYFSKINAYLAKNNEKPIHWEISP